MRARTNFGGSHYDVERLDTHNTSNKHLYGLWGIFEKNIPHKDPNGEVKRDEEGNVLVFDYLLDSSPTKKDAESVLNRVFLSKQKKR